MVLHAGARRKCLLPLRVDDQRVTVGTHADQRVAQLLEHGDVEDVQRRVGQGEAVGVFLFDEFDLHKS